MRPPCSGADRATLRWSPASELAYDRPLVSVKGAKTPFGAVSEFWHPSRSLVEAQVRRRHPHSRDVDPLRCEDAVVRVAGRAVRARVV
jgi:hypothetical protein